VIAIICIFYIFCIFSLIYSIYLEVLRAAGVQCKLLNTIRQRQLGFFGHVMRKHGLENLVVTGKVEGRRARGRQRLLDSLATCWEDKVSPTQIIRAAEHRLLWHQVVANVTYNGMVP